MNRAKRSFHDCNYSFGIESGLMRVPHAKTRKMEVCVCVIYDGHSCHIGLSSAFELPTMVVSAVQKADIDMSEAFYRTDLTKK